MCVLRDDSAKLRWRHYIVLVSMTSNLRRQASKLKPNVFVKDYTVTYDIFQVVREGNKVFIYLRFLIFHTNIIIKSR